jgi:hypothetical protein
MLKYLDVKNPRWLISQRDALLFVAGVELAAVAMVTTI